MGCLESKNVSSDGGNKAKQEAKAAEPQGHELQRVGSGNRTSVSFDSSQFITENKSKIQSVYDLISPPLGTGAFGEVRKAVHKATGLIRAVKIISKASTSKEEQERIIDEVKILKNLDHPNIIKIYEFYQDPQSLYIVTELCTGGELFDKIIAKKSFSERDASQLMKSVLSAINYCHKHNIVHRDIKPENILYESKAEDSNVKVIDFGTSRVFKPDEKMSQRLGTPYYISPEVLKGSYNNKCDIWSCGVMTYILLSGLPPFNGANDKAIMQKVAIGEFTFPERQWKKVSEAAKEFIRKLLRKDPNQRYSAAEALEDPWITSQAHDANVDQDTAAHVLENLRTFHADSKLTKAAFMYIANFLVTKEEKENALKIFKSIDKNNDGQLSREELLEAYAKHANGGVSGAGIDKILDTIDANKSGSIDYSEFLMATIDRKNATSKQRLESVFKVFDKDGNGFLTLDEILEMFKIDNNTEEGQNMQEYIKNADVDGDGKISYEEFKKLIEKLT